MIINKIVCKKCLIFLLLIIFFIPPVYSEELTKISVLPFEVYSSGNIAAIKESLYEGLNEELKKEKNIQIIPADIFLQRTVKIDQKQALQYGKSIGADFVIIGSLTQLGETLNIDARIIDVNKANVLPTASVQGKGLANLRSIVAQLKPVILVRTGLVQKIARIEIQGNRKIDASAIIAQIKSKAGNNFSEADVASDIKTIFKMGFFLDVTAKSSTTTDGKVVIFIVQEKGLISDIRINGNKALSKSDIQEVLTVKTRQNLNQEKIKEDIERIKILYDSKGYYNAEIIDRVEQDGNDFRVILDIKENDRLYVKSITFDGNEAYSSKELKNMMSTSEAGLFRFITDSGLLKRDQLKQDVGKLTTYYYNNGFINAQIGEPEITIDKKGIYIKIIVKEGKRFKIDKVEISGDLLEKSREELLKSLKVKKGDNYNREAIMRDIDFLTQSCNDEGYANADINPKINTRENEQLADIDYQIVRGQLVFINHINISGNNITRDKVIRRQLDVVEGDLYSSSKLRSSYSNLNRLRYFEEVDFQTEKGPDKKKMDVNIRVKEKGTGMFMIGAGYSAADQAVVMAQITQQNFLGYGQILSLKASLGSTTNNIDLSFTEPWLFDIPLWCKTDIWKYKKEYDSYTLDTRGAGLTLGYPLFGKIVGYLGYKLTADDITDVTALAPEQIRKQEGQTITSAVTLTLVRDTTNDYIFPSKGTKTSVSVTQAGGVLEGDTSYTQYGASAFMYYPLPLDVVFGVKGRVGYIQGHDGIEIPIFNRYVLGGINSLRGFRYIGPTNTGTSDVIGGNTMLVFNAEIVFPFIKDAGMKGVIFYDAGNSWNDQYDIGNLYQSVGLGLRWYSPIGPLRLEYGRIINRRGLSDDSDGRWEFTIGMPM
ncbi:outer membrane protein assembly factor yaet precursor [hydrocarbon metagenome]|uniref:Outer membrane protein assembly factor yaet n=1 Tax=hydrocarbon metagenome TaxID=938273 RepID=A0A0W8FR98_9ZZZZ